MARKPRANWDRAVKYMTEKHAEHRGWTVGQTNVLFCLQKGKRIEKKCRKLRLQVKEFKMWKAGLERLDIKTKGSGMGWCAWIRKGDASGLAQLFNGDVVYIEKGNVCLGERRIKVKEVSNGIKC